MFIYEVGDQDPLKFCIICSSIKPFPLAVPPSLCSANYLSVLLSQATSFASHAFKDFAEYVILKALLIHNRISYLFPFSEKKKKKKENLEVYTLFSWYSSINPLQRCLKLPFHLWGNIPALIIRRLKLRRISAQFSFFPKTYFSLLIFCLVFWKHFSLCQYADVTLSIITLYS